MLRAAVLAACMACGADFALALSGNEQVSLAGQGRFAELVRGIEEDAGAGRAMKFADIHALCFGYSRLKRYDRIFECLDSLDRFPADSRETRLFAFEDGTPAVKVMRAEALIEIAEFPRALEQAQQALAWLRKEKSTELNVVVDALAAQALAQLYSGKRSEAERSASELSQLKLGLLGRESVGVKALASARVNMALRRWRDVLAALDSDSTLALRAFLHQAASGAFLRGVDEWAWIQLPRAYMRMKAMVELGETERAKSEYDQLLATPHISANPQIHWMSLADRAAIAEAENDLATAQRLLSEAVAIVEQQRRSIHTEANKIGFIADKQDLYARLVRVQLSAGRISHALNTAERGKARAFVELLATRADMALTPADDPNVETLTRLRLNELAMHRQESAAVARSARIERGELLGRLPPRLASMVSVPTVEAQDIRAALAPGENLLLYFGHGSQLFAFVHTAQGVHGSVIDAVGLDEAVRQVRSDIQAGRPVRAQLQALYKRLIGPVSQHLAGSVRIAIVPHGALHYLPFPALADGDEELIERVSVRVLPSVTALRFLRTQPEAPLWSNMLVLGNPDLGERALDLPFAQREAEALGSRYKVNNIFLRRQATRGAFFKFAPQAPVIHVASHGLFDAAEPLKSGLVLAAEHGGQERVTVADLYGMTLRSRLVTLSACETGLGSVMSGDDVIGLTRAFLYAGASSVVATLWNVDDEATAYLVVTMYERLQDSAEPDALRAAQLATRKKFPHPVYWAGFYRTGS